MVLAGRERSSLLLQLHLWMRLQAHFSSGVLCDTGLFKMWFMISIPCPNTWCFSQQTQPVNSITVPAVTQVKVSQSSTRASQFLSTRAWPSALFLFYHPPSGAPVCRSSWSSSLQWEPPRALCLFPPHDPSRILPPFISLVSTAQDHLLWPAPPSIPILLPKEFRPSFLSINVSCPVHLLPV